MLANKEHILCTICARGGSKGVPQKNIEIIGGIPLIAHSIIQAKKSDCFRYIAVSSDDESILSISKEFGADFIIQRPAEMALDDSPKLIAIRHCAEQVEKITGEKFSIFADLDATSPLRKPEDISQSIALLINSGCDNIITACKARRSPYFNLVEVNKDNIVHLSKTPDNQIFCRQDAPVCYDMNASIYVWNRKAFFQGPTLFNKYTRLFEMPEERSIDIDSSLDFEIVKFLMEKRS
jgi:N-acylneuraminate cytidylyltransferase/CMP-N,N'-diacetyllegionaminic acid synthase